MRRLCAGLLVVASVVSVRVRADADFSAIGPALSEFRSGTGGEISLRFTADSFQVMRMTEAELDAVKAKALLPKEPVSPSLSLADGGNWIQRRIDQDTTLEEPLALKGDADARKWKKRRWETIGRYARDDWQHFVEFAIGNGLNGIQEIRYEKASSFVLSFAAFTPDRVTAGNRQLSLTNDFRSIMRLSPKYRPRAGTKGFVVLLHDPHENVAGRFQTLSGLKALISANSSVAFRFLVEGAYDGPSRSIGFSGLDVAIKPTSETTPAIVHGLLRRYLINTPMAYRLLYDRKIDTYAIDDNALLAYPAPRPIRQFSTQIDSLIKVGQDLSKAKVPPDAAKAKAALEQALNFAFLFLSADLRNASDSMLVEYYETVGELYRSIGTVAHALVQGGVLISSVELRGLTADAIGYSDQAAIYKKALDRNKTMAPEIIKAASDSRQIPIAFIGNYHTHGILAELDKASVGYVVIEPRPRTFPSDAQQKAFVRANHADTRQAYLSTAALNMGRNGPTVAEVTTFLSPKIAAKIPKVRAERLAVQAEFRSVPLNSVDVDKLLAAVSSNGSLSAPRIAAGGNTPPPGDFGKAFAYLDSAPDGRGANGGRGLIVTDAADRRWQEGDRYDFLRVALFTPSERANGSSAGATVMFYPDSTTNRLFFTYYEPKSKRIYCFEGTPQLAASIVPIPIGDTKGEQNVRTQIVEVIELQPRGTNE